VAAANFWKSDVNFPNFHFTSFIASVGLNYAMNLIKYSKALSPRRENQQEMIVLSLMSLAL
jgi:hypothetical protein